MVDTGAEASLITPEAAQRLGLRRDRHHARLLLGAGGSIVSADAEVRRYGAGSVALDAGDIAVGSTATAANAHVDGLLGADLLAGFEVDLDIPQSRLGLWQAAGCGADFDPVEGPHFAVPEIRAAGGHVLVPVRLNGANMLAVLDSGAAITVVTDAAAAYAGITSAALARDPGGIGFGTDRHGIAYHAHRFAEFAIGPERHRGPVLAVGPVRVPVAGMLLGADYLAHHRAWISRVVPLVFVAPER